LFADHDLDGGGLKNAQARYLAAGREARMTRKPGDLSDLRDEEVAASAVPKAGMAWTRFHPQQGEQCHPSPQWQEGEAGAHGRLARCLLDDRNRIIANLSNALIALRSDENLSGTVASTKCKRK
jgi:hypothetical protein